MQPNSRDTLPSALLGTPPRLLSYRVELSNGRGKSAGASDPVFSASGPAPPPAGALTAVARKPGALLTWSPANTDSTMELRRTLNSSAVPAPVKKPTPSVPGRKPRSSPPGEVVLVIEPHAPDPGGTYDRDVRDGDQYTYVAQRVLAVTLDGQTVTLRGLSSPPATLVYRDTFAPDPPAALVSVPGGGFGSAPSVDLAWDPSAESDVAGYKVYRSEGQGAFAPLTPALVAVPSYRDLAVSAGHAYRYRVTALDRHGNESVPSAEVVETLPR